MRKLYMVFLVIIFMIAVGGCGGGGGGDGGGGSEIYYGFHMLDGEWEVVSASGVLTTHLGTFSISLSNANVYNGLILQYYDDDDRIGYFTVEGYIDCVLSGPGGFREPIPYDIPFPVDLDITRVDNNTFKCNPPGSTMTIDLINNNRAEISDVGYVDVDGREYRLTIYYTLYRR